jgi:predicted ATPase
VAIRCLLLTGGPAAGKTTTGRRLAERRRRAAFVDVDDLRQLVVAGAAAPWTAPEGIAQARLGADNACALARRFTENAFDVVIADVVTPDTAAIYRDQLPGCLIVHLVVSLAEAHRRAATRKIWLTTDEFEFLHHRDATTPPDADHRLTVDNLTIEQQIAAVAALWR